jgi:hypothetical protein
MAKATHTQEPAKQEEALQAPKGFVTVTGTGKKDKYKEGKKYTLNAETAETLIAKGHVKK